MTAGYADLHLHTTASDGTQSIPELAKRAAASGLCSIAITDHDTISCDLTQRVTRIGGLEVITGVEIKVDFDGIPGELLGYFIDPRAQAMTDLFSFMKEERERRMAEMVERCQELLDLDISVAEVRALAGGSIGRPHLAQILVEKGTAVSMRDASIVSSREVNLAMSLLLALGSARRRAPFTEPAAWPPSPSLLHGRP